MASIHPRGDRWRVLWRDDTGQQRQRTFTRRTDASRFAATVEADLARGLYLDPSGGRTLFGDYATRWLASQTWRQTSADAAASQLRSRILPAFGHRPIGSIRHTDVQGFATRCLASGLAQSTTRALVRRLSSILADAVRDRLIPANPAAGVTVRLDPRTPDERAAALSPDQLAALVEALPPRLQALPLVLAYAGLRPGEAIGLTVDRVDFLRRTIRVDRQLVTAARGPAVFGPPKTPSSVRVVPLPDALADILAAHIAAHGTGPDGLLFRSRDGHALRRNTLGDTWQRATKDLDLPPGARGWHSGRHTYASAALASGVPVATVSRLLGHASLAETMTTYAHVLPTDSDVARNAAADALALPRPGTVR